MRKFANLTAAAAVVITSVGLGATPAEAHGRYGGWGYRNYDRISTGDVLGGLLVIGTIAAIASAASKDRAERRDRDDRYDPPYRDERRDTPNYEPRGDRNDRNEGAFGTGDAATRAADACSWAVEGEMGEDARVDSITDTQPSNGGWYVTGTASRLGGEVRSFGCSYERGRVVDVSFG